MRKAGIEEPHRHGERVTEGMMNSAEPDRLTADIHLQVVELRDNAIVDQKHFIEVLLYPFSIGRSSQSHFLLKLLYHFICVFPFECFVVLRSSTT